MSIERLVSVKNKRFLSESPIPFVYLLCLLSFSANFAAGQFTVTDYCGARFDRSLVGQCA